MMIFNKEYFMVIIKFDIGDFFFDGDYIILLQFIYNQNFNILMYFNDYDINLVYDVVICIFFKRLVFLRCCNLLNFKNFYYKLFLLFVS